MDNIDALIQHKLDQSIVGDTPAFTTLLNRQSEVFSKVMTEFADLVASNQKDLRDKQEALAEYIGEHEDELLRLQEVIHSLITVFSVGETEENSEVWQMHKAVIIDFLGRPHRNLQ